MFPCDRSKGGCWASPRPVNEQFLKYAVGSWVLLEQGELQDQVFEIVPRQAVRAALLLVPLKSVFRVFSPMPAHVAMRNSTRPGLVLQKEVFCPSEA